MIVIAGVEHIIDDQAVDSAVAEGIFPAQEFPEGYFAGEGIKSNDTAIGGLEPHLPGRGSTEPTGGKILNGDLGVVARFEACAHQPFADAGVENLGQKNDTQQPHHRDDGHCLGPPRLLHGKIGAQYRVGER